MRRKTLILLLCLMTTLLLTACHTDTDPWPANNGQISQPTNQAVQPTNAPQSEGSTPQAQPTQVPEGDDSSGLNG